MKRFEATRFGALLKRFRLAAGLSQEELAERARLTAHGISALERGIRRVPYRDTVETLAEALGLSPSERQALEQAVVRGRGAGQDSRLASLATANRIDSPPLIGREAELTTLREFLADNGPPVLLFAGEPGIGKTRLLDAAVDLAVAGGWTVLRGGCHRRGGQEPYAPVLDALAQHLLAEPVARQRTTLHGCAWLVRLLPELAHGPIEPLPVWDLSAPQEQRLIAAAVSQYVSNIARKAGTLLVLDDLQWAGADALELLDRLVRSPRARPLRVVGAYRDVDVRPNAPLAVLLADFAHAGLVAHQTLGPLTAAYASQLLDAVLGEESTPNSILRERVIQRTGGVPFYLVSYGQEKSAVDGEIRRDDAVPWGVAQSIRQRVAALSDASRQLLTVAAVIGRSVDPALLVEVSGHSAVEVAGGLAEAREARILDERATIYHFAHDLIREVVEGDIGSAPRLLLHRQVGDAIERTTGEPRIDLLAFHFANGHVVDKAIHYLELAGDHAEARFAHAGAISHYQDLIEILDRQGQEQEAARARIKVGLALEYAGRYDVALAVLERAAQAYQAVESWDLLAPVVARIGIVFGQLGRPTEGLSRLEKLMRGVALDDSPRAGMTVYLAMAALLGKSGRYREQVDRAQQASRLALRVGDGEARVEAERLRAFGLLLQGHLDEALGVFATVIPLAESTRNMLCLARALNSVGHCHLLRGRFAESLEYVERALEIAQRLGEVDRSIFYIMHHGLITFCQGDWRQARLDSERALALSRETASPSLGSHPLMVLGHVAFGEGRWDEAVAYLEESVRLAEGTDPESLEMAQGVLAEIDLRESRPAAAYRRVAPLLDDEHLERKNAGFLLPRLACAQLDLGNRELAKEVAEHAVAFARRMGARLHLVEALRVHALVAIRERDWPAGRLSLDEALAVARDIGYRHGEGRVLELAGEMEAMLGRTRQAQESFGAALAIFQSLGARRDTAETLRHLSPHQPVGSRRPSSRISQ